MALDVRRLLLLVTVAEHGSLTRAAAELALTQPSLSRQMAALEAQVGVRLLHRVATGVVPTVAGEQLLVRARAIQAQVRLAEAEATELRAGRTGVLRLAAFPSAAATLAVDAITAIDREAPGLHVTVAEMASADALDAVRSGRADIAVTFTDPGDTTAEHHDLRGEVLLREPMLAALSPGHPRATSRTVALRDLAGDGWIIGSRAGGAGLLVRTCASAGFHPRIVARLDHQPAIQAAVAAGLGVTLIPRLASVQAHPGIVLRPLRPAGPTRTVEAQVLGDDAQPAVRAGLRALRRAAKRLTP